MEKPNQLVDKRSSSQNLLYALKSKADAKRSFSEKIADSMTKIFGSIGFLTLNIIVFTGWILINIGWIAGVEIFDPFPFGLLTTAVSLQAIFLAIIVLISQNRAAKVADLREEVDLHVDIISEQEITKILHLVSMLCKKEGIDLEHDKSLKAMLRSIDTDKIETVLETQI